MTFYRNILVCIVVQHHGHKVSVYNKKNKKKTTAKARFLYKVKKPQACTSHPSLFETLLFTSQLLTIKLWEVINQVRIHDLLFQQVLLVKEQDHRGVLEPRICDDGPEQSFTLLHAVLTTKQGR